MSSAAPLSRRLAGRRLTLVAGAAAALPFLASAAHALVVRWTPYGDDAVIATRAIDTLTRNSPLFGQWTSGPSSVLHMDVYTPGPSLYWLLALPARLLPPVSMSVLMGLLNAACAVGAVALARRRGGTPLMLATAIVIPIMLASLPASSYSDVWNPSVPLPPLLLLIFLGWSVGCGELRLLPLTVLVASFVAQTHLSYVAPAAAVVAVALAGLVLSLRSRPPGERGPTLPWAAGAAVIAVVLWAPPIIDEATSSPGNLALLRIAATADEPKLGIQAGGRAVVHTLGLRPSWLEGPLGPLDGIAEVTARPGTPSMAAALLVLMGLVAVAVIAAIRRRLPVALAAVLALALCAAVAADAASTPLDAVDTVHYTLRWASVAGMFSWLVLGWSLVELLGAPRRLPTFAVPAALAAAFVAGAAVAIAASPPEEPYEPVRAAADAVVDGVPGRGPVRVAAGHEGSGLFLAIDFQAALVYALRRDGRAVVAPTIAELLGPAYEGGGFGATVQVDVDTPPPASGSVLVDLDVEDTFEQKRHTVTVSLIPRGGG